MHKQIDEKRKLRHLAWEAKWSAEREIASRTDEVVQRLRSLGIEATRNSPDAVAMKVDAATKIVALLSGRVRPQTEGEPVTSDQGSS